MCRNMPLFLLRYVSANGELLSFAIVAARDGILARRAAAAADLHHPGVPATADEVDPAKVPAAWIGRKLMPDILVKKPRAASVRRRRARARASR